MFASAVVFMLTLDTVFVSAAVTFILSTVTLLTLVELFIAIVMLGAMLSTVNVSVLALLAFPAMSVAINLTVHSPFVGHPNALAFVVADHFVVCPEVKNLLSETLLEFPIVTVEPESRLVSFIVALKSKEAALLTFRSASSTVIEVFGAELSINSMNASEVLRFPAPSLA